MRSTPPIFERFIMADCLYHQVLHDEENSAFDQLKAEARDKNPWAITRLAHLAIEGKAVYHDVEGHIEYGISMLLPLAERGFAFAQYRLAEAYLMIGQNKQAIDMLEQCVQAKIPDAAYRLFKLYEKQHPKRAKKFRELAERWGYNEADFDESLASKGISATVSNTSSALPPIENSDNETFDTDFAQSEKDPISWLKTSFVRKSQSQVKVYSNR
ncbi:hypothetical protein [Paenibacillus sp. Leaf72]|uniref:hypothetical protein n=1 Tax=Paenibacillus sp. Leaf72 TaxID=1736234 RepID=UPI0006F8C00B|nr:hypothetical protein [Paenibacillus sp. Leaf72]KQN96193.1 hypothetical protein ASF12_25605 [Paenibacillus sp. Leaf72]